MKLIKKRVHSSHKDTLKTIYLLKYNFNWIDQLKTCDGDDSIKEISMKLANFVPNWIQSTDRIEFLEVGYLEIRCWNLLDLIVVVGKVFKDLKRFFFPLIKSRCHLQRKLPWQYSSIPKDTLTPKHASHN